MIFEKGKVGDKLSSYIMSVGLNGLKGQVIKVEATVRNDKEQCIIIGLPDATIKESRERILNSLHSLAMDIEMKKLTINLSPADLKKSGTGFDGAMLLAVVQELLKKKLPITDDMCIIAALSLDGHLLSFQSLIPTVQQAIQLGFKRIYLPPIDMNLFAYVTDIELLSFNHIRDIMSHLQGKTSLFTMPLSLSSNTGSQPLEHIEEESMEDFSAIRGHEDVKRAMEICAAGGHHLLMSGPPGCGKSLMAHAFHSILPDMTHEEMLEVYSIYQLTSQPRGLSLRPPKRAPHHTTSEGAIQGGGRYPKPGEISLAHRGVLFLDELGHFQRRVIDTLRQPLELGFATVNRVEGSLEFPAAINLITATNPCPCGYAGSSERYCTCSDKQILKYLMKVTGPIIDRIDFVLQMKSTGIFTQSAGESSAAIRVRVTKARNIQRTRYGMNVTNCIVPIKLFEQHMNISSEQLQTVQQVCFEEKLSSRSTTKILRLARTIADLAGTEHVSDLHLSEAIEWKKKASAIHTAMTRGG
jgi:magnesium chelatase family protein